MVVHLGGRRGGSEILDNMGNSELQSELQSELHIFYLNPIWRLPIKGIGGIMKRLEFILFHIFLPWVDTYILQFKYYF